jgi:hypothetical protein
MLQMENRRIMSTKKIPRLYYQVLIGVSDPRRLKSPKMRNARSELYELAWITPNGWRQTMQANNILTGTQVKLSISRITSGLQRFVATKSDYRC